MGKDGLRAAEHGTSVGLEAVEGSSAGKAFDLATIEQAWLDPVREVVERLERPAPFPLGDDGFHRLLADTLERSERIADRALFNRKESVAGVHIRRQAFRSAPAHILDEQRKLVGLRHV